MKIVKHTIWIKQQYGSIPKVIEEEIYTHAERVLGDLLLSERYTNVKGSCLCGYPKTHLTIVRTKKPINVVLHNKRVKELSCFALGTECINTFRVIETLGLNEDKQKLLITKLKQIKDKSEYDEQMKNLIKENN